MENSISQEHKNRLDVEMHRRGLSRSRSHAADLIKRGKVSVHGNIASKSSQEVTHTDEIIVQESERFVSRAGEKLSFALEKFGISPAGLVALDVGSSTGGFTDCLLQHNVRKVIAVDVGSHQFAQTLLHDPRIELHEGTDIRKFTVPEQVDLAVIDVSFISLSHILEKIYASLKKGGKAIALVKPQFEVGMELAKKNQGVITDAALQATVVKNITKVATDVGFKVGGESQSPIEGEKGNKEFLLLLKKA